MDVLQLLATTDPRMEWPAAHKVAWIAHVFGVILWMGGLLLLTRFLAMHTRSTDEGEKRFYSDLEKRVHRGAVLPGLIIALAGGIFSLAAFNMPNLKMGWFHAKLLIAMIFVAVQAYSLLKMMEFSREQPDKPSGLMMGIHMSLGVLLLAVLILIRFKPF